MTGLFSFQILMVCCDILQNSFMREFNKWLLLVLANHSVARDEDITAVFVIIAKKKKKTACVIVLKCVSRMGEWQDSCCIMTISVSVSDVPLVKKPLGCLSIQYVLQINKLCLMTLKHDFPIFLQTS